MEQTVHRWKAFAFYDYAGVENYLETMAGQGFQLDKRHWGLWKFKRTEPECRQYEVVYTRRENMRPSERIIKEERIAENQWQRVTVWKDAYIYTSALESPCSIATSEMARLETLHRNVGSTVQVSGILLAILATVMLAFRVRDVMHNPVNLLSSNMELSMLWLWLMLVILSLLQVCEYRRWKKQMTGLVQSGGACMPASDVYRRLFWAQQIVVWGTVFVMLAAFWLDGGARAIVLFGMMFLVLSAGFGITDLVMKKCGASISAVRIGRGIVAGALVFSMFYWVGYVDELLFPKDDDAELVTVGDILYPVYDDAMLMTLEELGEVTDGALYTREVNEKETFLLRRTLAQQAVVPYFSEGVSEFSYEMVDVKAGFLYNACLESCKNRLSRHTAHGFLFNSDFQSFFDEGNYSPEYNSMEISDIESGVTVYKLFRTERDSANGYLFLWPGRIVSVCMTEKADVHQLKKMAEAFSVVK